MSNPHSHFPGEKKYRTRYGMMTAAESAQHLFERSLSRLRLLDEAFRAIDPDGEGIALQGYANVGLADIMQDIAEDMNCAFTYYLGEDPEPGKTGEGPEVRQ